MPSLAPFAEIEAMINKAVASNLANATATHGGGPAFPVLFDRQGVQPAGAALDVAVSVAQFEARHAPGLARGAVLVIAGESYTVESSAEPDASGWVTVDLFPAPAGGA